MNKGLYKTVKFKNPAYVGDPINAIKIYNEKEVDELIFLDIAASSENRSPDYKIISNIASECFMPLCYGGGIKSLEEVKRILEIGVEKVSLNSAVIQKPKLVTEIATAFGSQSVIVSIDIKKNFWGKMEVFSNRGTKSIGENPLSFAKKMEEYGAGELLITSIDKEGTWDGYDTDMLNTITSSINIPVIANGGAGTMNHLKEAVEIGGASAVAMGSMVVYQKKGLGVLINFPKHTELEQILY
jgi:cyclase